MKMFPIQGSGVNESINESEMGTFYISGSASVRWLRQLILIGNLNCK